MATKIEWTEKVWSPIPHFEGYYASKDGYILSKRNDEPHILKPIKEKKDNHLYVFLYDGNGAYIKMYVHRLILMAWVGLPQKGQIGRHLNDIANDNRLENLAWGAVLDNAADRIRNGGQIMGENHFSHKLSNKQVIELRKRYAMGESSRELAKDYGISHTNILTTVRGEHWKHLPTFSVIVSHSSAPKTPMSEKNKAKARLNIQKAIEKRRAISASREYRLIPCACGCGNYIETPDKKGRERKYIHGHNNRKHGEN